MRYLLTTILAIILLNSLYSQCYDLTSFELKGNVQSVKESYYSIKINGNDTIKGDSLYHLDNLKVFNEKGYLVSEYSSLKPGNEYKSVHFNEYDSIGRRTRYKAYIDTVLFYDIHYSFKDTTSGYIIYKISKGILDGYEKILLSPSKKLLSMEIYNEDGSFGGKCEWIYNKSDLLCNEIWYDTSYIKISTTKYIRNSFGYNIKIINDSWQTTRYHYTYDIKKNWIFRMEFVNDIPKTIVEREIKYYNN